MNTFVVKRACLKGFDFLYLCITIALRVDRHCFNF